MKELTINSKLRHLCSPPGHRADQLRIATTGFIFAALSAGIIPAAIPAAMQIKIAMATIPGDKKIGKSRAAVAIFVSK